ncbi:hypothetical protein AG1IA_06161 [Rhizoctonia solani AG-1 IA]|uniref:Uncharacterized protein n=1 Tax=Thanatephorus cucumeris (strain AG1-IA) TaxID=983506 RepID=L8WPC2_THACA|nr:hypothetical protein AG1IA_06161 [Rhizoctonia solani AG-1 IA]
MFSQEPPPITTWGHTDILSKSQSLSLSEIRHSISRPPRHPCICSTIPHNLTFQGRIVQLSTLKPNWLKFGWI